MLIVKITNLERDLNKVTQLVNHGEVVMIERPLESNLVVLSEEAYHQLEKLHQDAENAQAADQSHDEEESAKWKALLRKRL